MTSFPKLRLTKDFSLEEKLISITVNTFLYNSNKPCNPRSLIKVKLSNEVLIALLMLWEGPLQGYNIADRRFFNQGMNTSYIQGQYSSIDV